MPGVWHGREWQDFCVLLLQKRYGAQNSHSLQLVPDRHKGDLGIEAFSHDGFAYQCYAAEEPLSVKECFEKQRDKLTADLGKLRKNQSDLIKMLGPVAIRRYIFMIHRHDSRQLVTHATAKAAEVIGWGLPFVDSTFAIVVETDDDYALEREAIYAIPPQLVTGPKIEPGAATGWSKENEDLRTTAEGKLTAITKSSATRDRVLESLIAQYLQGENALERLRSVVPDVHAGILAAKSHREDLLILKYPPDSGHSRATLSEIADDFATLLRADYPMLSEQLATTLAWAAVADWLMRCPLDFEAA